MAYEIADHRQTRSSRPELAKEKPRYDKCFQDSDLEPIYSDHDRYPQRARVPLGNGMWTAAINFAQKRLPIAFDHIFSEPNRLVDTPDEERPICNGNSN